MTYQELTQTDDLSYTVPNKINENARTERFLNIASPSATFVVFADDTTGSPKDIYLVTTVSSAIEATLPAASATYLGRVVTIMKADAGSGAVTIEGNAAETINGATSVAIPATQFHYRTIMCDGSNWVVISSS